MKDKSAVRVPSFGRRAASYWHVDGLPELLFGLTLVGVDGLAFLWGMEGPKYWRRFDFAFVYAGIVVYLLLERRALDFLKLRLTYPRTGYAQPPEELDLQGWNKSSLHLRPDPPARDNVTSFRLRTFGPIGLFLFLWASAWAADGSEIGRWFAPLATFALAVALYALNRRSERPYRWWSALILALAGLVFLWVDVPGPLRRPLPLLLTGAWLAAQGGYTLLHYLQLNPHPRTPEGVRA